MRCRNCRRILREDQFSNDRGLKTVCLDCIDEARTLIIRKGKACSLCEEEKGVFDFHADRTQIDGRKKICKKCLVPSVKGVIVYAKGSMRGSERSSSRSRESERSSSRNRSSSRASSRSRSSSRGQNRESEERANKVSTSEARVKRTQADGEEDNRQRGRKGDDQKGKERSLDREEEEKGEKGEKEEKESPLAREWIILQRLSALETLRKDSFSEDSFNKDYDYVEDPELSDIIAKLGYDIDNIPLGKG
jgi:hypothetical protein